VKSIRVPNDKKPAARTKSQKPRWTAEFEARMARASAEVARTGQPAQLYPELPMILDDDEQPAR
jgi:hypothetical protein